MLRKISRLFVIKTRFEAFLIIYALALGATARGSAYLVQYPGFGGQLLYLATTGAVFLGGAKILDCIRLEKEVAELRGESQRYAGSSLCVALSFRCSDLAAKVGVSVATYPRTPGIRFCCPVRSNRAF